MFQTEHLQEKWHQSTRNITIFQRSKTLIVECNHSNPRKPRKEPLKEDRGFLNEACPN